MTADPLSRRTGTRLGARWLSRVASAREAAFLRLGGSSGGHRGHVLVALAPVLTDDAFRFLCSCGERITVTGVEVEHRGHAA